MEKVAVIVPGERKEDHKPYNLRFVISGIHLTNIIIIMFCSFVLMHLLIFFDPHEINLR